MSAPSPSEEVQDAAQAHTARERLEARSVRLAMGILGWLPLAWASGCGSALGWFLFRVVGFARREALRNLDIAFGDTLPIRARWAVAGRCYRLFGALLCEFLSLPRLKGERLWRHFVFDNLQVLAAAHAAGRGVVLLSGHLGNWELVGAGMVAAGYPITVYTGGQRNALVDGQINAIRAATGQRPVGRYSGGVRGLLRALRTGHVVALAADQHESTKRHYVGYFGQPVSVSPGPYLLARHTGAPVVFATTVRVGLFRYRTTFEAMPKPRTDLDQEQDLLEFLQRGFAKLERDTRAHPDHYFWMHRRFRPIPTEVTLTPANRAFLEGRLAGPVDSFWEQPAPPAAPAQAEGKAPARAGSGSS
jgi:KDO2-lipid IV(A) lauroyltransferase